MLWRIGRGFVLSAPAKETVRIQDGAYWLKGALRHGALY